MSSAKSDPCTKYGFLLLQNGISREWGLRDAYRAAIEEPSVDPYVGQPKRGDLAGFYGYDVRYAGTNYEIAYLIYEDGANLIVVVLAGSRENFYEQLKKYIQIGITWNPGYFSITTVFTRSYQYTLHPMDSLRNRSGTSSVYSCGDMWTSTRPCKHIPSQAN